jgi:hypothetical protein
MSTPVAEQAPPTTSTPGRWAGIIGIEGEATGDGRFINDSALRWDLTTTTPLRFVSSDVGAHDGAVVVGNIDRIERRPGGVIWATGPWDSSETAAEASRLVGTGMMDGVSMDLDDVTWELRVAQELLDDTDPTDDVVVLAQETTEDGRVVVAKMTPQDELTVTTDGRIRSATIVAVPAFARAKIANIDTLTAADGDIPAEDGSTGGDGQALFDEAVAMLEAVDQMEFLSPEYLAATDEAGDAFAAAAIALKDSDPEMAAKAAEVAAKLKRFASLPWGDPEDVETRETGETADIPVDPDVVAAATRSPAVTAAAAPIAPPEEWFTDPGLAEPTPLTIDKDGRVYGHLATWDVCHVASPAGPGICIVAPHSNRDYSDFHTGTVETYEETLIATGKITMDTGHAGQKLSATAAASHYDNTGTAVADVRAGEDMWGIWVSGALRPHVTDAQKRALRASPLSGDWRERGGSLELIAALAVNVPGFPIPRTAGMVASGGDRLYSLVASGMVPREPTAAQEAQLSSADVDYLHRLVQRNRVDEAKALRLQVLRARVDVFATQRRG